MAIPHVATLLPHYHQLIVELAAKCQRGTLNDWEPFKAAVLDFFTPAMMDAVDGVVPGWHEMSTYADRQTLHHVTSVLVALLLHPTFQDATPEMQDSLLWMVLFHDVAKIARSGEHDYIHAFRSAAIAGKAFAKAGFLTRDAYAERITDWFNLTHHAVLWREDVGETIQDNRHLPVIVSGLEALYQPPAIPPIKAILLHLSLVTDPGYPILAPLTDSEIVQFVDPATFPMLKTMMLVDTGGWNLFDAEAAEYYRRQTESAFEQIAALIGL